MSSSGAAPGNQSAPRATIVDRALRAFSDVRAGESTTVLLMLLNIFLVLTAYYVIKTVREPLILTTGGAELKIYAGAVQACVLILAVPAYSWFAKRVSTNRLVLGMTLFFIGCLEAFYVAAELEVPFLGFIFFVWVGMFSLMMIAQFWSFANDIYNRDQGERLFPIVAIGASAGALFGSKIAAILFDLGFNPYVMLQIAAAILGAHFLVYVLVQRRTAGAASGAKKSDADEILDGPNGLTLVFRSRYLRLIALLLILLNLVNTTGGFILDQFVSEQAQVALAAQPSGSVSDSDAFLNKFFGVFFGNFYFLVNVVGLLIQALLVSRIVKYLGIAGALLALPIVAAGAYGIVALGAGFVVLRWAKTAENATDYSVMNTAKALIWLPTSRDEKYKGKQAVDTVFVRLGDVLAAGLVALGLNVFKFGPKDFALTNLAIVGVWLFVAALLIREYKRLSGDDSPEAES